MNRVLDELARVVGRAWAREWLAKVQKDQERDQNVQATKSNEAFHRGRSTASSETIEQDGDKVVH